MSQPSTYSTMPANEQQSELEKQKTEELAEVLAALLSIRRESGWGTVMLVLQNGDLTDIEVTVHHKRKKKNDV